MHWYVGSCSGVRGKGVCTTRGVVMSISQLINRAFVGVVIVLATFLSPTSPVEGWSCSIFTLLACREWSDLLALCRDPLGSCSGSARKGSPNRKNTEEDWIVSESHLFSPCRSHHQEAFLCYQTLTLPLGPNNCWLSCRKMVRRLSIW